MKQFVKTKKQKEKIEKQRRNPPLWNGPRYYDDDQSDYRKRGKELRRLRLECGESQMQMIRVISKALGVPPVTQQAASLWEHAENMRVPEYIFDVYKKHALEKIETMKQKKRQVPILDIDFMDKVHEYLEDSEW